MRQMMVLTSTLAACLGAATVAGTPAMAQQIVHALSGTVTNVDTQGRSILLKTNDGSEGSFQFPSSAKTEVDFDRGVQGRTTPVSKFNKTGDSVVLFFYGGLSGERTAVAVQDLGPGPFDIVEGTLTSFNKHQHTLSVKTSAGNEQKFILDPKAMADTTMGAVAADHFEPSKGDNVRVIATKDGPQEKALFVRD